MTIFFIVVEAASHKSCSTFHSITLYFNVISIVHKHRVFIFSCIVLAKDRMMPETWLNVVPTHFFFFGGHPVLNKYYRDDDYAFGEYSSQPVG